MSSGPQVLDDPEAARSALSPIRRRILDELASPDSATGVARRLGLSRQKVNYHLRILEEQGLVELAEQRARRGTVERMLRRRTDELVVDPRMLQPAAPLRPVDAWAGGAIIAAAADAIRAVGALLNGKTQRAAASIPMATVAGELTFPDATALQRFLEGYAELCAKHDRPRAKSARRFAVALLAYPSTPSSAMKEHP